MENHPPEAVASAARLQIRIEAANTQAIDNGLDRLVRKATDDDIAFVFAVQDGFHGEPSAAEVEDRPDGTNPGAFSG
jgi:hypothetical protein